MKSIFSSPNTESENKSTTQITGFNGGLGVAFPLGKNATFDVLGGYSSITFKDKDDNPNNARGVVGHWGLKIGFNVFLNGKSSAD